MSYRIGLTGGIGSGKSTVAALFAECGATVIDSDAISHRLTQPSGAAIAAIRAVFGDDYIDTDGALARARMRQRVFSDPVARLQLEAILHPLIRAQILAEAGVSTAPYILLVVPLLFEAAGYLGLVQRSLVVDCTEALQVVRAMQRSGLDEQTVRAIMATQMSSAERLRRADEFIQNNGSPDDLRRQVEQLHRRYLAISAGSD